MNNALFLLPVKPYSRVGADRGRIPVYILGGGLHGYAGICNGSGASPCAKDKAEDYGKVVRSGDQVNVMRAFQLDFSVSRSWQPYWTRPSSFC